MMELQIVVLRELFNFNNAREISFLLFIILEFSDRIIFAEDLLLLDKNGFTVFQKLESFFSYFVFK